MPVTKSVQKALRRSQRKRARNLKLKQAYKKAIKELKDSQDPTQRKTLLPKAYSAIDKAAKKGVLHPNKAARLKAKIVPR